MVRGHGRAGVAVATVAILLPILAGCGGGEKKATTDTGSLGGFLSSVQITPAPGSTFISKSTRFYLTWTADSPPPPTFTAALQRYSESTDDSDQSIDTQKTVLSRIGNSYVWQVSRKDDFDLDSGGVYYLQLDAGPEEVNAAYIVTSDGRAKVSPHATEAPVQDAGSEGAYRHLVTTR